MILSGVANCLCFVFLQKINAMSFFAYISFWQFSSISSKSLILGSAISACNDLPYWTSADK
ncbi:MAG TPA: hypothetical protein O0W90_01965 [Methanocorpusculum sp.]|nr:hypothetical protein [Methanocorpusculum sp.]